MNAQKEALRDGIKKFNMPNLSGKKESAAADAGFAILEKAVSNSHLFVNLLETKLFIKTIIFKPDSNFVMKQTIETIFLFQKQTNPEDKKLMPPPPTLVSVNHTVDYS